MPTEIYDRDKQTPDEREPNSDLSFSSLPTHVIAINKFVGKYFVPPRQAAMFSENEVIPPMDATILSAAARAPMGSEKNMYFILNGPN